METALENILTNLYKDEMISYMDAHPEYYEKLIEIAVSDEQPYSWRAAWLLWSCMKENDPRIQNYINDIISTITTKKDGHQRELLDPAVLNTSQARQADITSKVCQGPLLPKGYARFR